MTQPKPDLDYSTTLYLDIGLNTVTQRNTAFYAA
jgi:hypothetical protein